MIIFKNTNQIKSHHQQQLTAHKGLLNALKNKIQSLLWPVALPDLTGACLLSSFPELLLLPPTSGLHPVWVPPGLPASSPQHQSPCRLIV